MGVNPETAANFLSENCLSLSENITIRLSSTLRKWCQEFQKKLTEMVTAFETCRKTSVVMNAINCREDEQKNDGAQLPHSA